MLMDKYIKYIEKEYKKSFNDDIMIRSETYFTDSKQIIIMIRDDHRSVISFLDRERIAQNCYRISQYFNVSMEAFRFYDMKTLKLVGHFGVEMLKLRLYDSD